MQQRVVEAEWMDDPSLDARRHAEALRGLARLNRISRASRIIRGGLADLVKQASPQRPLRVLDLASGGGDVAIAIARHGGPRVRVRGCDISGRAVRRAAAAARRAGADVEFFVHDALRDALPGECDVVTCSLFLHHLQTEEARELLRRMADAAGRRVLVDDLHRSRANRAMVAAASRLVTRSPVVHVDGVRSMNAAFTAQELRDLAAEAGLDGARVRRHVPCRMLLSWSRP